MSQTVSGRVRMTPDGRREQLLELGVRLLSTRSLDDLTIEMLAEEAGVSRGLLYHYFANLKDFRRAVVRKAADDLIRVTAPVQHGEPLERLARSLDAYVSYVEENFEGYTSLVRGAAGGNEDLREIYEEARAALTDRIFEEAESDRVLDALSLPDTPVVRLMVRGWSSMCEEVVISWVRDPHDVSREELLTLLAAALPGVLPAG
ncbi:MAG: TetR/AcrR family transcriptional regulator [Nocardioidaceae bacterium]|nr:TetR/AcrR family transcriptional regulator [Nocardioidaceae bacterium]NUS49873.1 TetR/AcrR family transcriptional regulator [Nocardioidaceae bacterium]